MKTFLPYNYTKLLLLFLAAFLTLATTQAQSTDDIQEIPELVFRNPSVISGTSGKEGAVYLFKNVAIGFDATIKLKKFSDPAIYMKNIDNTDFGWDKAFQPEFGMNTVKPNQKWYIDFELNFLEAGTTNKKKADRFTVTSLDVDGDGSNVKEFVTLEKASSVTYAPASYLLGGNPLNNILPTCCECGKQSLVIICTNCLGTGNDPKKGSSKKPKKCSDCDGVGKIYSVCKHSYCGEDLTAQGPVDNFTNIDTTSTAVMATYVYNNKETVNFTIGAVSGSKSGGAGVRLNSMWFKAFSLAPAIVLPVRLNNFSAFYNNTTVTLNWKIEAAQNFSHFVIERSEDGQSFNDAGIAFSANSDGYVYNDKNTNSATGVIYYRLKSVDKAGEINYSSIRSVKVAKEGLKQLALTAYPNPTINEVRVTFPNTWQGKKVTLEIINASGLRVQSVQFPSASTTETVQMQAYSKGLYIVKASCDTKALQQALIKN